MALRVGHELFAPGEVTTGGNLAAGVPDSSLPTWGVGNPVAASMAGLSTAVSAFADTWDGIKADEYIEKEKQRYYRDYLDPDTGVYNTNLRGKAEGTYSNFVEWAKREVNDGAYTQLTERQKRLVNKPLANFYQDAGTKVATFENKELMEYHQEIIANNVNSTIDYLAKSGMDSLDNVAGSLVTIQHSAEAMAKIHGWSEETTANYIREKFGAGIVAGAAAASLNSPQQAHDILYSYRDMVPENQFQAALKGIVDQFDNDVRQQYFYKLYAEGIGPAKEYLLSQTKNGKALDWAGTNGSALEWVSGSESSGRVDAVNEHDGDKAGNDGMSFGLYQIRQADNPGGSQGMTAFASYLKGDHSEASKAITAMLALPRNERKAEWKRLTDSGVITKEMQSGYITETMISPAMNKLGAETRAFVEGDDAALRAFTSTVINSGPALASKIFNDAWNNAGRDNLKFYDLVYEKRVAVGTPPNRAKQELAQIKGMLNIDGYHNRQELGIKYTTFNTLWNQGRQYERQNSAFAADIRNTFMPAAFAEFQQTGNTESIDILRNQIAELGDPKLQAEFNMEQTAALKLHPWLKENANLPLAQRIAGANRIIQDSLNDDPYAVSNAHLVNKLQQRTAKMLNEQGQLELSDPYGAALLANVQMTEQRTVDNQAPTYSELRELTPEQANSLPPEQQAAFYLGHQNLTKRMVGIQVSRAGGNIQANYKVLSLGEIKAIKANLDDETISTGVKLDNLVHIARLKGSEYWANAANDLGLNGGVVAAIDYFMANGGIDRTTASALIGTALLPNSQFDTQALKQARVKAESNPLVSHMAITTDMLLPGSIQSKWQDELVDTVAKLYASGRDDLADQLGAGYTYANTANSRLSGTFGVEPVANVLYSTPINYGWTAEDEAEATTQYIRSDEFKNSLPMDLLKRVADITNTFDYNTYGDPNSLMLGVSIADNATTTISYNEQGLRGLQREGIWIRNDDGINAVLYFQGMMLIHPDGTPITMPLKEKTAAYLVTKQEFQRRIQQNLQENVIPSLAN